MNHEIPDRPIDPPEYDLEPTSGNISTPAIVDWVDCIKDGVPDEEGDYLCHFRSGDMETFRYDHGDQDWWTRPYGSRGDRITHWAALPSPPTSVKVTDSLVSSLPDIMMLRDQA